MVAPSKRILTTLRGLSVFTTLSLLASFTNFLFNFAAIRILPSDEFRDVVLANNFINVFGNIFVALNIIGIALSYSKGARDAVIAACQKVIYLLYGALLVVAVVLVDTLRNATGIQDGTVLGLVFVILFASIPVVVLNAIYVGEGRFTRSGILSLGLSGGRLLLGVVAAALVVTQKDHAMLASILAVYVVMLAIMLITENKRQFRENKAMLLRALQAPLSALRDHWLLATAALVYAVTINFAFGFDLFLFGGQTHPDVATQYATVSVIGKLAFFFVAPVSLYLGGTQLAMMRGGRKRSAALLSAAVSSGVVVLCALLLVVPVSILSALLNLPESMINREFLLVSVVFNGAVVLANHHFIETIIHGRFRTALAAAVTVVAGFIYVSVSRENVLSIAHSATEGPALLLLAVFMCSLSAVLFAANHRGGALQRNL